MMYQSDRKLIQDNTYYLREAFFSCTTEIQVECSVSFARFLNWAGLNQENYLLFLRLIMTNNSWVIDALIDGREPRLLFSTIRPNAPLIQTCFDTLTAFHPDELYHKALEALLGVIEGAYFDADEGYHIHPIRIMDINALGKFLLKQEVQEHQTNRLILHILDRLTHLGESYRDQDKSIFAKHAFNVRYAYFDKTRDLIDAIPHPLLVRMPDTDRVAPEEDFADLVLKRAKKPSRKRVTRQRSPAQDEPTPPAAN